MAARRGIERRTLRVAALSILALVLLSVLMVATLRVVDPGTAGMVRESIRAVRRRGGRGAHQWRARGDSRCSHSQWSPRGQLFPRNSGFDSGDTEGSG